ncbi:MAG TPA: hypothetical protein VMR89_11930 [Actinomycetota bacterium]|nr:hypothetical protein [Actinomycetota bacterium]
MPVETYLEVGAKRTFAGALDWPGWCRSSRHEEDALEALLAYGPRYAGVLKGSGVRFSPPARASTFDVVERLKGDATTDFGAPSIVPKADAKPVDRRWLARNQKIVRACWASFDRAAENVDGPLTKGPRGGGREVDAIVAHVVGAEASYARMIGADTKGVDHAAARDEERAIALSSLEGAVTEGIPAGPRGGKRWSAPYFVRRAAWHVLDHAWEIEDRSSLEG